MKTSLITFAVLCSLILIVSVIPPGEGIVDEVMKAMEDKKLKKKIKKLPIQFLRRKKKIYAIPCPFPLPIPWVSQKVVVSRSRNSIFPSISSVLKKLQPIIYKDIVKQYVPYPEPQPYYPSPSYHHPSYPSYPPYPSEYDYPPQSYEEGYDRGNEVDGGAESIMRAMYALPPPYMYWSVNWLISTN